MIALLDAYNIIRRHPHWKRLGSAEGRQALLGASEHTRWPTTVTLTVVVFDSRYPPPIQRSRRGRTEIVYASPSADEEIMRRIRDSEDARQFCVVSDDREIIDAARAHGAAAYSVSWWVDRTGPAPGRPPSARSGIEDAERRPPKDAKRISDELAKRWGLEP